MLPPAHVGPPPCITQDDAATRDNSPVMSTLASVASGPLDLSTGADCRSRSSTASIVRPARPGVASEWPIAQRHGDGPHPSRAYARRSPVPERACPTRRRRRAASTSPDARGRRRSFDWCVGLPASAGDDLRRSLRARVRPVAARRRAGGGQVPRLWRARARLRPHPLRCLHARVFARILLQVSLRLSQLPRQAPRDLDAVAGHHAPRARAAPAGGAHYPDAAPRLLSVPAPPARRDRPRRRPHRHRRHSHADL